MSEIVLVEDWDSSINFSIYEDDSVNDGKSGYFAGRENEVDLLSNDIARKTEGSILIRGYPGVGKTSLVLKSLQEVDNEDIIPVFLSGPDMREEGTLTPKSMMDHLARRLYVYTKEEDLNNINNLIETFYLKTVYESKETFRTIGEDTHEYESESEVGLFAKLSFNQSALKIIIYSTPFIFGGLTSLSSQIQRYPYLPVVFSAILLPIFHISYKRYSREKKQRITTTRAESLYERDSSLGNLKFDINKIHRRLTEKRIVYIIDELDKVDIGDAQKVLEFFKDFFTSSNALFIFVGGEGFRPEMFVESRDNNIHRPRSYTYFHSQYFIPRPRKKDLFSYLKKIVKRHSLSESELDQIFGSLCFQAKNDFFDLKTELKNRIEDFNGQCPILRYRADDKYVSNLYIAVTLFEDAYSAEPSKWEENEKIARTLFDIAFEIQFGYIGQEVQDPSGDSVSERLARDFHHLLYRHGIFDIQNSEQEEIEGIQIDINTYTIKRKELDAAPEAISEPTEFEREFLEKFNRFCLYHLPLVNILRESDNMDALSDRDLLENPKAHLEILQNIDLDTASQISDHISLYRKINTRETQDLKRDEVDAHSNSLESQIQNFKSNQVAPAFSKAYFQIRRDPNSNLRNFADIESLVNQSVWNYFQDENPPVLVNESDRYKPQRIAIFSSKNLYHHDEVSEILMDGKGYVAVLQAGSKFETDGVVNLNLESPESLEETIESAIGILDEFFFSALKAELENSLPVMIIPGAKERINPKDKELLDLAFEIEQNNKSRITLLNWIGKNRKKLIK